MTEQKIEIDVQRFKNRHSREGGNLSEAGFPPSRE